MATSRDIITRSFRELGLIKAGDSMSEVDYQEALISLNALMNTLSNDKDFAYSTTAISKALTGTASITVGATGTLVAARPIKIDSATFVLNGITYDVDVVGSQEWDAIEYKAATGTVPEMIYYDPTMPDGTVYIYPVVNGGTLYMRTTDLVNSFADLTTTLTMPPGYEECLIKNLAVNISPQYPEAKLSAITVRAAANSTKKIKRTNHSTPILSLDSCLTGGGSSGLAAIYKG